MGTWYILTKCTDLDVEDNGCEDVEDALVLLVGTEPVLLVGTEPVVLVVSEAPWTVSPEALPAPTWLTLFLWEHSFPQWLYNLHRFYTCCCLHVFPLHLFALSFVLASLLALTL